MDLMQTVGGWSDARIMRRYAHVREARVSEAAERFDAAFEGRPLAQR